MCAICVLKRRKRERERDSQGHSGAQEVSNVFCLHVAHISLGVQVTHNPGFGFSWLQSVNFATSINFNISFL